MARSPEMIESRLDLPTPSGAINPTMQPAGTAMLTAFKASVSPNCRLTSRKSATGSALVISEAGGSEVIPAL